MATQAKGTVTDIDRGYKRIRSFFRRASKQPASVLVGLRGDGAAGQAHTDGDLTIAEIGSISEFGLSVPERSFIRAAFDDNVQKYIRLALRLSKAAVDGTVTQRKALIVLAEAARADIIRLINSGIPPELAASTIARKGSSKQLIETGQLKQSIDFKIVR